MIRAFLLRSRSLPRTRLFGVRHCAVLTRFLSADVYSTESDSAGEEDPGPSFQQGSSGPVQPGRGLEGRKLQLSYGGGVQGAGASFRTPEQEAAEDARRMRLFRGMQATVIMAMLSAAVIVTAAIIEGNAAVGCSVDAVVTRTDEFMLTIDTTLGLNGLTVRCTPSYDEYLHMWLYTSALCFASSDLLPSDLLLCLCCDDNDYFVSAVSPTVQASTFAGGITVLRNMATQGRPIVTVSVAVFAQNDFALGQLASTALIEEDTLTVTISAPESYATITISDLSGNPRAWTCRVRSSSRYIPS